MSAIGFARFFIAERIRQRGASARASQWQYMPGTIGHEESKFVADCYESVADWIDGTAERRRAMALACQYPITLSTAERYDRKHGHDAAAVIERALREGRAP